ncbi:MAG: Ig-like domain-containing protein [Gemmatimonadota bacterium]
MKRIAFAAAAAFLLASCSDSTTTVTPTLTAPSSSFVISDGAHGGNSHFYFLPPLVPSPTYSGTFNPSVLPTVDICQLGADSSCVTTVRTFTYHDISVLVDQEMYKVNWNTTSDALDPADVYRIIARVGGDTLGYRDVQPVDGPTSSDPSADVYLFNNGATIPIKFRIEKGSLCDTGALECDEVAVFDSAGGTIPIPSGGLTIQSYSLPGYDAVTLIVERMENLLTSGEECVPGLDLPQFGPCIRIRTEPELTEPLLKYATVSICITPGETGLSHSQADLLRTYKWDEGTPGTVKVLPNSSENICSQTVGLRENKSLLSRALAAVGSFFVPPAYAIHDGAGSLTKSFSRFRWALPARLSINGGNGQVAPVSTAVSVPPSVIVQDENGDPVENARVHWDVTAGGGTVVPLTVYSNASGIAQVTSWTLGATQGLNTLDAWGFGISDGTMPYGAPQSTDTEPVVIDTGHVQFTATACAPGFGKPQAIDGTMAPGEWGCANHMDFTANLSGGSGTPATLYWMNDGDSLYMAVSVVRDASDKVASLRFDFDNNNDGIAEAGEDAFGVDSKAGFFDEYLTAKCANSSQAGCGEDDVKDGGYTNGLGAIGYDGTRLVYELAHPLNSGDTGHDFALAPGDTVGTFLTLQVGNGASGNTQIPGFRVWMPIIVKAP